MEALLVRNFIDLLGRFEAAAIAAAILPTMPNFQDRAHAYEVLLRAARALQDRPPPESDA